MKPTSSFSYLALLICLPHILAQPPRYEPWQRLDIQQGQKHGAQKRDVSTTTDVLLTYAQKLPLWITALSHLTDSFPQPVQRRSSPLRRQISEAQLSSILQELDEEFQALIQLLAEVAANGTTTTTTTSSISPSSGQPTPSAVGNPTTSSSGTYSLPTSTTSVSSYPESTNSPNAFDPMAGNLNFAYYSQTPQTSNVPLSQICNDTDIDVVILAFVSDFFSQGGYPTLNLGPNCWTANAAQTAAGATGLLDCVSDGFAGQVQSCQSAGKKVLLSLGGAISNTAISDDSKAEQLATTLWNLFLGGSDDGTLRPFGSVVLDGFDIDNETPANSGHIPALASSLRALYATDTSKAYYLSAAPQCPIPDQSIPVSQIINYLDFLNVQFYNNPSCELGSGTGFLSSVYAWSQYIDNNTLGGGFQKLNNGVEAPLLMIGTLMEPDGGNGYVNISEFESSMQQVKSMCLKNLGGVTFWDGANEEAEGGGYARSVREILGR